MRATLYVLYRLWKMTCEIDKFMAWVREGNERRRAEKFQQLLEQDAAERVARMRKWVGL